MIRQVMGGKVGSLDDASANSLASATQLKTRKRLLNCCLIIFFSSVVGTIGLVLSTHLDESTDLATVTLIYLVMDFGSLISNLG